MPQKPKTPEFGTWQELRILRERTGWSSADLAKEADMLPSLLSMLENGKRWPTPQATKKLAAALKVPYTVLERPAEQKEAVA
jgi:transcriptional regulator with XRE-family HTH domain